VVLLFFATLSAAGMAYGTHPGWARFEHGMDVILMARRLQGPMGVASVLLCLTMVALVIAGKKRAWWLIGLAPVMVLFGHRFMSDPADQFVVTEEPLFVAADDAKFVGEADSVVGLRFADQDYAYPYAALFQTPVVLQTDHDQRIAVMWSPYANRVTAVQAGRELRAADLDVVSMPANALLVYNKRLGQFINALTGLTPAGGKPNGFKDVVPATKTTWKAWRTRHPETKVMMPLRPEDKSAPRGPITPAFPLPPMKDESDVQVMVLGSQAPLAMPSTSLKTTPLNLTADDTPVLLFRDPVDGTPRAFARRVEDLRPRFRLNTDRKKRPKAVFVDDDTGAGWDANGVAVDGPPEFRGKRLARVLVEDGLSSRVMRHWYPNLKVVTGE
jgi:hypothetical protein